MTDLVREYTLPAAPAAPARQSAGAQGVSFTLQRRSLGVVGESGSGKIHPGAHRDGAGRAHLRRRCLLGRDLHQLDRPRLREARRDFQMVFQDPYGSLDPRQTVARIVSRTASQGHTTRAQQREQTAEVLAQVGLAPKTWTNTRTVLGRPAPAHCHRPRLIPAPAHRGRQNP